ncbi:MAG: hypothetical protein AAGA25_14925 [Planctomycetota bacterium]
MPEDATPPADTKVATPKSTKPAEGGDSAMAKKTRKPKKVKPPIRQVVFHTYPKLLFIWPLIVAGFLLWPTVAMWDWNAEVIGWIYLITIAIVVLTIGVDLERDHAVFWLVVFLALFFLGKWLDARFDQFTVVGNAYRWLADRDVQYDASFGLCLSLLLLPPYVTMLIYARLQHRWRITHNEFEHYSWGRADDSLARGAKRVRSTFPDLLELLLCGAGTLVVYSATGRTELRRIPHVPMIFLVRRRINKLLETTSVVTQNETAQNELYEEEADTEQDEEDALPGEESSGIGGRDPL